MRSLALVLLAALAVGCDSNDVPTCADGELVVEDAVVGSGQAVTPGGRVVVAYTGTLEDGTVFDSSPRTSFSLGAVIAGFRDGIGGTDGVSPMRIGGQRTITIPPNQAYGGLGRPGIPSCSTLEFDVTLIDIG